MNAGESKPLKNWSVRLFGLVLMFVAVTGCSVDTDSEPPDFDAGPQLPYGEEYLRLNEDLVQAGASVEPSVPIIWSAEVVGHFLKVNLSELQVFEYVTVEEAERAAAKIALDGISVGFSGATWVGPPHFFTRGRLIVLFVGDDPAVQLLLEQLLGPQFAGHTPFESSE